MAFYKVHNENSATHQVKSKVLGSITKNIMDMANHQVLKLGGSDLKNKGKQKGTFAAAAKPKNINPLCDPRPPKVQTQRQYQNRMEIRFLIIKKMRIWK